MAAYDEVLNPLGLVGWDPENRSGLVVARCSLKTQAESIARGMRTTSTSGTVFLSTFNTAFRFDPVRGIGFNPVAGWVGGAYNANTTLNWNISEAGAPSEYEELANTQEGQFYFEVDARVCMGNLMGSTGSQVTPLPGRGLSGTNQWSALLAGRAPASGLDLYHTIGTHSAWVGETQDGDSTASGRLTGVWEDFRDSYNDGFCRFILEWRGTQRNYWMLQYSRTLGRNIWRPWVYMFNGRGGSPGVTAFGWANAAETITITSLGKCAIASGLRYIRLVAGITNNATTIDSWWLRNVQICRRASVRGIATQWPRRIATFGDSFGNFIDVGGSRIPYTVVSGSVNGSAQLASAVSTGAAGSPLAGMSCEENNIPVLPICVLNEFGYQPEFVPGAHGGQSMIWGRGSGSSALGGSKDISVFSANFDYRIDGKKVQDWKRGGNCFDVAGKLQTATSRTSLIVTQGEGYRSNGYLWHASVTRGTGQVNTSEPSEFSSATAPAWTGTHTTIVDDSSAGVNGATWTCIGPDPYGLDTANGVARVKNAYRLRDIARADITILCGAFNDITPGNSLSAAAACSFMYPGLIHPLSGRTIPDSVVSGSATTNLLNNTSLQNYAATAFKLSDYPDNGPWTLEAGNCNQLFMEWAWIEWVRSMLTEYPEMRLIIVVPCWPAPTHGPLVSEGNGACFSWERLTYLWRTILPQKVDVEWGAKYKGRLAIVDTSVPSRAYSPFSVWEDVTSTATSVPITGISTADNAVFTYSGDDIFNNGDWVYLQINGLEVPQAKGITALNTGAKTFQVTPAFDNNPSTGTSGVAYLMARGATSYVASIDEFQNVNAIFGTDSVHPYTAPWTAIAVKNIILAIKYWREGGVNSKVWDARAE